MKSLLPLLLSLFVLCPAAAAGLKPVSDFATFFKGHEAAFVLLDVTNNTYSRYNPERCKRRFTPCSTFKIPNSLIGLETGVVPDVEHTIRWNGVQQPIEPWNRDHTLRSAFSNSVLWYYQEVATRIGPERMKRYVRDMRYGNVDTSGGITKFWLESTLKISPEEQVQFLQRLHRRTLPFKPRTMAQVEDLMKLSESGGVIFRGKTGTAGDPKAGIATLGWFVGSVTRGKRTYLFATNISGGENPSGRTARAVTERILRRQGLL